MQTVNMQPSTTKYHMVCYMSTVMLPGRCRAYCNVQPEVCLSRQCPPARGTVSLGGHDECNQTFRKRFVGSLSCCCTEMRGSSVQQVYLGGFSVQQLYILGGSTSILSRGTMYGSTRHCDCSLDARRYD